MSSMEAYQADLEGLGIVLIPLGKISPIAKRIDDTYIYELNPRVFLSANPEGKIYTYKRNYQQQCWFLVEGEDDGN